MFIRDWIRSTRSRKDQLGSNPLSGVIIPRGLATETDFARADVVQSPVRYVARQSAKARPQLVDRDGMVVDDTSGVIDLLDSPMPDTHWKDWIEAIVHDAIFCGRTFVHIVDDDMGRVTELRWVPYERMVIMSNSEGAPVYMYARDAAIGQEQINAAAEDIIVFRNGISPDNTTEGVGLRDVLNDVVGIDSKTAKYTAEALDYLPAPYIALGFTDTAQNMDPDEIAEMGERFQTNVSSNSTAKKTPVVLLPGLDAKNGFPDFKSLDLQTFTFRSEVRVCAWLGVNPTAVGFRVGETAARVGAATHELLRKSFEDGVLPHIRMVEAALSVDLLGRFVSRTDVTIRLGTEDIFFLRYTPDEAQTLVGAGIYTVNEMRAQFGLPELTEEPAPDTPDE